MNAYETFAIGAAGAAAFEMIRIYDLYSKVPERKLKRILTSKVYLFVTLGLIAASGFIAWGVNANAESATAWQLIISGIGARALVSKPIELASRDGINLGSESHTVGPKAESEDEVVRLQDVFA